MLINQPTPIPTPSYRTNRLRLKVHKVRVLVGRQFDAILVFSLFLIHVIPRCLWGQFRGALFRGFLFDFGLSFSQSLFSGDAAC